MAEVKRLLAIDLGASSGRAMLGKYSGGTLQIEEIHRFENTPVYAGGTLYWDILRLLHEIRTGMRKAREAGGFDCVAVDTWGVDYGLLTDTGRMVGSPVHYRDARTSGMVEKLQAVVPDDVFYGHTGIAKGNINTVYQLMADKQQNPALLGGAQRLLMMPDLLNYFLTGKQASEETIASTTQLFDAKKKDWCWELIDKLGLPRTLFAPVVKSGTVLGQLDADLCEELGITNKNENSTLLTPAEGENATKNRPLVVATCGHDTQCAEVAVPADEDDFIFISCGTWALMGTELDEPVLTNEAQELGLSNESGFAGKTSFLQNITGLWLIQESRRQWQREGQDYNFAQLEDMARETRAFESFIAPNNACFAKTGDLPGAIRKYCKETNQPVPQSVGAAVRCIYESLAMQFRKSIKNIAACTGKTYNTIHMLGGGVKDKMLCQMTADACGCTVLAGPNEATVWGNILVQLVAMGELSGLKEARALVRSCGGVTEYKPQNTAEWDAAYSTFCKLT